ARGGEREARVAGEAPADQRAVDRGGDVPRTKVDVREGQPTRSHPAEDHRPHQRAADVHRGAIRARSAKHEHRHRKEGGKAHTSQVLPVDAFDPMWHDLDALLRHALSILRDGCAVHAVFLVDTLIDAGGVAADPVWEAKSQYWLLRSLALGSVG